MKRVGREGPFGGWSWLGSELDTAGVESVENRERWRLAGIGRHWPRGGLVGDGMGAGEVGGFDDRLGVDQFLRDRVFEAHCVGGHYRPLRAATHPHLHDA